MLRVVVDRAEASGDNRSVEETDLVAGRWLLMINVVDAYRLFEVMVVDQERVWRS